ncbi:MAG TPA: hydroxyisourate hydrolase [Candidatus Acidoferrales bacterium]|nr:hydroxyisourate hydrolase [Candidatus Acidoferrales bacterium]
MRKASVSTHVLDVGLGLPAAGLEVSLHLEGKLVASARTDAGGRVAELGKGLEPGAYRLVFETGEYFKERDHLFERVTLDFRLDSEHHHVPLLLGPYSCTSYRGS